MEQGIIQTVCGPLPAGELGHCQMHEHIFVADTPAAHDDSQLRFDDADKSLRELLAYKAAGGGTIVDAQPVGAGRNAALLAELSEQSGVHIVASTGYHLRQYYWTPPEASEEALYERWCAELTEGLEGETGRLAGKAGIVKAAIPAEEPAGYYGTLLRAAARAAADCGAALMLHTEAGQRAEDAIALCVSVGLPAGRILICHADRNAADAGMHRRLADLGVFLEYDTIARPRWHSDEEEIRLILEMLNGGYGAQLLLSLDTTAKRLRSYGGVIGLDHLLLGFLPLLRERDVSDAQLRQITIDNPARALALR